MALGGAAWRNETRAWRCAMLKTPRPNTDISHVDFLNLIIDFTTRSTRRINKFVMVQARTNTKAMCLSVYGVKLWNSLSNNLMDCNRVIIF